MQQQIPGKIIENIYRILSKEEGFFETMSNYSYDRNRLLSVSGIRMRGKVEH
jgi:hypothetical protein